MRTGKDFNERYPAALRALAALADETVVDGEVVGHCTFDCRLGGGRGVSLTKGSFHSPQASDIPSLRPLSRHFSGCELNWFARRNRRN